MMKTKFSLLFGIVVLFLIAEIYADVQIGMIQTLGTIKAGDCIALKQICSSCSQNTIISVLYPNLTTALGTEAMTKTGNEYNYTFCDTLTLGRYIVNGYGDPGAVPEVWAYDFYSTTTGNSTPYVIPLFIGLGAFIFLIFSFLMKNNYMGFITGALFIVLGIYLLVYGLGVMSDFYTQTIAYVALGFGLLIFLASSYSAINETGVNLFRSNNEEEDENLEDED